MPELKCRRAVVKLGGSVITVKDKPETVNPEAISYTSRTLADHYGTGGELIIVHGGGSFGHYAVKKIIQEKGRLDVSDAPLIQASMLRLAGKLLGSLLEEGIPATLHPAHTLCGDSCSLEPLVRDLGAGLAPVTYGDAVVTSRGVYILSGDDLAADVSIAVGADCLIYATNVPGVLKAGGEVVRILYSDAIHIANGVSGVDVTGGMARKVKAAIRVSDVIGNVRIIHYRDLPQALAGLDVGTRVLKK